MPLIYHRFILSAEPEDVESRVEICLLVETQSGWWKGIGFNSSAPIVEGEAREGYQCTRIEPSIGKVSFWKAMAFGVHTFIEVLDDPLDLRPYANHRVLFVWKED